MATARHLIGRGPVIVGAPSSASAHHFAMPVLHLVAHPTTPCDWVDSLTATVERTGDALRCRFLLRGDIGRLRIPPPAAAPTRTDGLWRHTCFELFTRLLPAPAYAEFNFAPSGHWAAYRFDDYRQGMRAAEGDPPLINVVQQDDCFELTATLPTPDPGTVPMTVAVSAVLEDQAGRISYWALRHPDGKPDFHHDAGFAARI